MYFFFLKYTLTLESKEDHSSTRDGIVHRQQEGTCIQGKFKYIIMYIGHTFVSFTNKFLILKSKENEVYNVSKKEIFNKSEKFVPNKKHFVVQHFILL